VLYIIVPYIFDFNHSILSLFPRFETLFSSTG
jgi:hypothetical protein